MRKKRLFSYMIMIVSVIVSVKLVKDIYRIWHVDDRIIEAERGLETAKQEREELEKKLKETESGFQKEKQIRDTLKMAKENEVVIVVPEEVVKARLEAKEEVDVLVEDLKIWEKWRQVFMY